MVGPGLLAVGADAVQRARDDAGGGGLSHAARTPVSMKAWAMRPVAKALDRVRTSASWPIRPVKSVGRYLRARTR